MYFSLDDTIFNHDFQMLNFHKSATYKNMY